LWLLVQLSLHKKLNFIVSSNYFSSSGLFERVEQVKIAWRKVRTIGGLWQYFTVHLFKCSYCHSGGVRTRAVVNTDAFDWSNSSFWTKGWLYSWSLRSFE
jgi:hypothetical protein